MSQPLETKGFPWTAFGTKGIESFSVLIFAPDEKEARAILVDSFTRLKESKEYGALRASGIRDITRWDSEWGKSFDIEKEIRTTRRSEYEKLHACDSSGEKFSPDTLIEWAMRVQIKKGTSRVILSSDDFADYDG